MKRGPATWEAEEQGIYGEATIDEATNLLEEDIPVNRIPWRRRTDSDPREQEY